MFLSHLLRRSAGYPLAVAAAFLIVSAPPASAQSPRIPPDAKGYQRARLLQQFAQQQALESSPAPAPSYRTWYLPQGAPTHRSYTYYAPPRGYTVIREGTPSAPQVVTVVGPDGRRRTYRLEGPVVMRLRYVPTGNTSR
jgi:hypothetical protein